jgi:hypothetical protein
MKKVIELLSVLIILAFIPGCRKRLSTAEYAGFIKNQENGLQKTISVEHFEYNVQYRPHEYMVAQENPGQEQEQKKRLQELAGTVWFNVGIKCTEGSSPLRYQLQSKEEYDQRLNYYLNEAAKDIRLVYGGKDTLPVMAYAFENSYNLTPVETMVVGFALPKGNEDETELKDNIQLVFSDRALNNGIIKATFHKSDINNIPHLIP